MSETRTPPDALLLMGKHCPYCPTVLKGLQALAADGTIGSLQTVVIEDQPEIAAEHGVRSVPWVRIGPFELAGLRSEQELREWASKANTSAGIAMYLDELLSSGKIDKGLELVREHENGMTALLELFASPDTQLNTRIGISAIIEEIHTDGFTDSTINTLATLLKHENASIRGDACHYLALTGEQRVRGLIQPLCDDPDPGVREIAEESLLSVSG